MRCIPCVAEHSARPLLINGKLSSGRSSAIESPQGLLHLTFSATRMCVSIAAGEARAGGMMRWTPPRGTQAGPRLYADA